MTIGEKIKYYRRLRSMSQKDLGEKIEADARTISNYETGKYKPSLDAIVLIAKVFSISVDDLLMDQILEKKIGSSTDLYTLFSNISALPTEDRKLVKDLVGRLIKK